MVAHCANVPTVRLEVWGARDAKNIPFRVFAILYS